MERRSRDRGIHPTGRRTYLFRDMKGELVVMRKSNKANYVSVERPKATMKGKVKCW